MTNTLIFEKVGDINSTYPYLCVYKQDDHNPFMEIAIEERKMSIIGYPTEKELQSRILEHLSWNSSDRVVIAWRAYLSALFEWGKLENDTFSNLLKLLPEGVGAREVAEIAAGEPLTKEELIEIEKFQSKFNCD